MVLEQEWKQRTAEKYWQEEELEAVNH